MPYIGQPSRDRIDPLLEKLFDRLNTRGDMNYAITRLLHLFIMREGQKYNTLNDAMGIIECVKQEFYRTVVAPYEGKKISSNGYISELDASNGDLEC